jgi:hypothetical protein
MRAGVGIKDWFDGAKGSVLEPVGSRSEPKMERLGDAMGTALTGAAIGALTGTGSALAPDGLSPKALGIAALVALGGSAYRSGKSGGRALSNAGAALSALAVHEYMGSKVASKAGTTTQVLTNKAKAIAAHGDSDAGQMSAGADPLITWGARKFAAAH